MPDASTTTRLLDVVHCAIVGAVTLGVGIMLVSGADATEISRDENRRLAAAPTLDADAVFSGTYTKAVEAYVSDHFPGRESLLEVNVWLRDHRGYRSDDALAFYAVDLDAQVVREPIEFSEAAIAADDVEDLELDRAALEELEVVVVEDETATEDPDDGDVTLRRGVFVHDGRGMQIFGGSPQGSRGWAAAVNAYRVALPNVRLVAALVPSSQEFYLPESARTQGRREKPNIDATYGRLADGVHTADVLGELWGHTDEYIYFRTDHHWTGLGAYYGYRAICAAADLDPIAIDRMAAKTNGTLRGSLARMTKDPSLVDNPDRVEYWVPPVATTAIRRARITSKGVEKSLVREGTYGYGVFLGGDFPVIQVDTDLANGRRGVLVKNSIGNPVAIYLASHFETLFIVDYRYFRDHIVDLVVGEAITDVIIVTGTHTANTPWQVAQLRKVLDGGE